MDGGSHFGITSDHPGQEVWSPPVASPRDVTMWPTLLKALTRVWEPLGANVDTHVARAQALAALVPAEAPRELQKAALDVVDGLVEQGVLASSGEDLVVAERLRPWLSALWSGHRVELEYAVLPQEKNADLGKVASNAERMVFVGEPGHRVLCTNLVGEDLSLIHI